MKTVAIPTAIRASSGTACSTSRVTRWKPRGRGSSFSSCWTHTDTRDYKLARMASLEGKVAAITGASSGIGEATALALADAGAKVSLAARRKDRLDALVEKIGDGALAIETDIGDEEQARAFVQRTKDELGGLDILINNAGVMLLGPLLAQEGDDWRTMVEREHPRPRLLQPRRAGASWPSSRAATS